MGSTLVSALKHPITLGALGGGLVGGGLGYLAADDPALRNRSALVGAGTGAAMGGLGGAMASGGYQPEEVQRMQDAAFGTGRAVGHKAGIDTGYQAGVVGAINRLPEGATITKEMKDRFLKRVQGG